MPMQPKCMLRPAYRFTPVHWLEQVERYGVATLAGAYRTYTREQDGYNFDSKSSFDAIDLKAVETRQSFNATLTLIIAGSRQHMDHWLRIQGKIPIISGDRRLCVYAARIKRNF